MENEAMLKLALVMRKVGHEPRSLIDDGELSRSRMICANCKLQAATHEADEEVLAPCLVEAEFGS